MKKFGKDHKENDNSSKDMTAEDVFKLIGAMLVSLQVQKEHEFIYRAMIKSMDKHWSAGSLLADAQDYVDRLGSSNNATKTDVSFKCQQEQVITSKESFSQIFRRIYEDSER